jgi:hypothetical protein
MAGELEIYLCAEGYCHKDSKALRGTNSFVTPLRLHAFVANHATLNVQTEVQ